jgi:hypothetical protein
VQSKGYALVFKKVFGKLFTLKIVTVKALNHMQIAFSWNILELEYSTKANLVLLAELQAQ